jgi:EAL domain-containing protein (putative c-di-GMP-specific phosphodiesterase class I)
VRQALKHSGMPAECLQLEITESLAAESPLIQSRLHELKALGVKLALDDFGTGYSSLASLHQWPVDVIKIDRSFVSKVTTSAHHRVLVEATVMVARSLSMKTVAEGVETVDQADVLTTLRCDKAQGYLYARPMGSEEATRWLAAHTPVPARLMAP